MKREYFLLAALGGALALGGITAAQAHTVEQCRKQVKAYTKLCKFSPTALIMGMCVTKNTYKWCSDKKLHKEKFHK